MFELQKQKGGYRIATDSMQKMLQTQWVIYSAEMRYIHKWSIDGLGLKIE